jgi:hypothetical protein
VVDVPTNEDTGARLTNDQIRLVVHNKADTRTLSATRGRYAAFCSNTTLSNHSGIFQIYNTQTHEWDDAHHVPFSFVLRTDYIHAEDVSSNVYLKPSAHDKAQQRLVDDEDDDEDDDEEDDDDDDEDEEIGVAAPPDAPAYHDMPRADSPYGGFLDGTNIPPDHGAADPWAMLALD